MAGDWETVELGEVAAVRSGYAFKSSDWKDAGIPVVKIANVKSGRLEMSGCSFVSESTAAESGEFQLSSGDILIAMTGYIGDVARVRKTDLPCVLNQRVGKFSVRDTKRLDADFLYTFLAWAETQQTIERLGYGSAQPNVSPSLIHKVELPLPPLAEQKAIAAVLGALDDKIELNRRMNATLETMARALFQSWFIDFDPVRQNMDRNQPSPQPSPTGRGSSIAEGEGAEGFDEGENFDDLPNLGKLFPDSFRDSELGPIPAGWEVKPVGEVVNCVGGGTPSTSDPKYWEGGTHHWTTPKDFSSLQAPILLDTDRKLTNAGIAKISSGLLPAGTLLLSSRAPVGYLAIAAMPVAINQGFIGLKCNDRASNFFMLNWCQTNMAEIESRATGTTFAEISKQNFRPIPLVLPPKTIMDAFTATVEPFYTQITANLHQSRTLATLRDTLLPQLLSGNLPINNQSD
jgi:type I restriction enzyme S subunit